MKERSDPDENQINREQKHSEIFRNHDVLLNETRWFCTQKHFVFVGHNVNCYGYDFR